MPYAALDRLDRLNQIGVALSAEKDMPRLLEMILLGAQAITQADGGTLTPAERDTINNHIATTSSSRSRASSRSNSAGGRVKNGPVFYLETAVDRCKD